MIKELMNELTKQLDDIEGIIADDLLSERELRYVRLRLVKEQQRISAMAAGMSEDELILNAMNMMKKLFGDKE